MSHDTGAAIQAQPSQDLKLISKDLLNVLILIGQANVDLNFRRRDLIRPDLNVQFQHLCANGSGASQFTDLPFGDGLKDKVREIAETNRVCTRLFPRGRGAQFRGRPPFRGGHRYSPYPPVGRGYQSYQPFQSNQSHRRAPRGRFLDRERKPAQSKKE